MKYNEKYDRWVTKGGLVYRYDFKQDKLVLCKLTKQRDGYLSIKLSKPIRKSIKAHRLVYETFIGDIPQGYEIDHINAIRDDNRIENLKLCTHKENMNNPLSIQKQKERVFSPEHCKKISEAQKGIYRTEFGRKFKEHFGIAHYEDIKLYDREWHWYKRNDKCSWEK